MKEWYQKTSEEALTELQATREGLTEEKARALLAEKGENALQEGKKKKVWQVFLEPVSYTHLCGRAGKRYQERSNINPDNGRTFI